MDRREAVKTSLNNIHKTDVNMYTEASQSSLSDGTSRTPFCIFQGIAYQVIKTDPY